MLNQIKHIAKHSIIYSIGNIAAKIIGLLLIPIYTNPEFFTQSEFGVIAILESTFQLLLSILSFAMTAALARWYWDKEFRTRQKSIYFTCFTFLALMVGISSLGLYLNTCKISQLLFKTDSYTYLIKLMSLTVGISILNNLSLTLIKLKSKSLLYSGLQILKLTIALCISLYYIIYKGKGIDAIWEANIIGELILFVLLIPYNLGNFSLRIELAVLKDMIRYGAPLMLASISSVLLSITDKYMLNSMSGLEQTALYSLAGKIANTLKVIITLSINAALAPIKIKKINEPNNQRFYSKVLTYVGFIFMFAAIPVCLFSQELITIVTANTAYIQSANVVPILSLSLFMSILSNNVIIGISIKKKTKISGTIIIITSLINIALNLFFIPIFDIYGAAISTLLSQVFFFITLSYFAQKLYFIPYEWKKVFILVIVFIAFTTIGLLLTSSPNFIRIAIKITLVGIFPLALYWFKFYDQTEIDTLKIIKEGWNTPKKLRENIGRLLK